MIRKYWASIYAPMYNEPNEKSSRMWLPIGSVLTVDEDISTELWYSVVSNGKPGWIRKNYLELYNENFEKNPFPVENQTPEQNDLEQYIIYNAAKQVNLCGQLCVAYILNKPIIEVLDQWKEEQLPWWKRVFSSAKGRGTGYGELQNILTTYDVPSVPLTEVTRETIVGRSLYTPERMKKLVDAGYPLVAVKIDSSTGRLRGQGIGHWVIVTDVITERTGYGLVFIYNPAPHRIEVYSWQEFIAGTVTSGISGLYVKKEDVENVRANA